MEAPQLEIEAVAVEDLDLDPRNARDHSDPAGVEAIKASLLAFGQRKPIVAWRGASGSRPVVKAGNGTLIAARALGWGSVLVAWADGLSEAEVDAYALADNQTALLSRWDEALLRDAVERVSEPLRSATGFTAREVSAILRGGGAPPKPASPGPEVEMGKPVHLTAAQRRVVEEACESVRANEGDESITEGRCLELVCADFLAGA